MVASAFCRDICEQSRALICERFVAGSACRVRSERFWWFYISEIDANTSHWFIVVPPLTTQAQNETIHTVSIFF